MPQVFVSHCAKHDPRSKAVVERLVRELTDDELELVWDRELLQVGDDWDDKLLDKIETCDGAILILCETALKRSYVVKECTLLAQRKRHSEKWGGNTFELLTVLVGDVTVHDLVDEARSHMKDLNLGKYQVGSDKDLRELISALGERLKRLKIACRAGTPRRELVQGVANQIRGGKPGVDQTLSGRLKIALPLWIAREASLDVRTLAIAIEMPGKRLRSVGRALAECKDELDGRSAIAIINRLAPFTVPTDAAARIPEIAASVQSARSLQVNARELETGRWYAQLACGSMLETRMTEVTGADDGTGADTLFSEIVDSVKALMIADTCEEAKEELEEVGTPVFVLVPRSTPAWEVVEKVYAEFPQVTLVFLTGEKVPPGLEQSDKVILLKPLLAPGQEEIAHDQYEKTKTEVRRAYGG